MTQAHKDAARARISKYPAGHMARIRSEAWKAKTPLQRKAVGRKLLLARKAKKSLAKQYAKNK